MQDKQLLAMPVAPQLASGLSQTYLHRLVAYPMVVVDSRLS